MDKVYKLELLRNQYDRIADTFNEANGMIAVGYDVNKDTVIFTVSEDLRKRFAKFAVKSNHPKFKKKGSRKYWITQMFLPENINQFEVR